MAAKDRSQAERVFLIVARVEAMRRVGEQLEHGNELVQRNIQSKAELDKTEDEMKVWSDFTVEVLRQISNNEQLAEDFQTSYYGYAGSYMQQSLSHEVGDFRSIYGRRVTQLRSIMRRLEILPEEPALQHSSNISGTELVVTILRRFHNVGLQLRRRHANRATLEISDEYDAQDLLHALLRLHFADIRQEEWTPSYAGGSARMDFLLKPEQIVIEVKKSRKGLGPREIGDQLLVDIARYGSHPDCKTLVCFVYDPEILVPNPDGLERDLSKLGDGIVVKVIVAPKGE